MHSHYLVRISYFQAVRSYITTVVQDGEQVAIVWFSSQAFTRVGLTTINDESRVSLLTHIPIRTDGATSIGSGVLEAVEVLTQSDGDCSGTIIIFTDGEENTAPYLSEVLDDVS